MEERICERDRVLSLEWKVEGVTDGENEGDDCDDVVCAGWGEPGGDWTECGWWNEEGSWFHRWGDAYLDELGQPSLPSHSCAIVSQEWYLMCVSGTLRHHDHHSPSGSSSWVTLYTLSAMSKANWRFSRGVCRQTLAQSMRSGLHTHTVTHTSSGLRSAAETLLITTISKLASL